MQNQITCPQCNTPYLAEATQIIDVREQPSLKQLLLQGRLNVAVCPSCQTAIQLAVPMVYHDPKHDLLLVYVPVELNLAHVEQEKLIGQFVKQIMDNVPAAERRAYLLQPLTIIKMQTFMEKVLETEGVTPVMIAKQKRQLELLQKLITGEKGEIAGIIQSQEDDIDETFFSILESTLQQSIESQNEAQTLRLTNLQAKLLRESKIGQQVEKKKIALHKFQQDVRKQEGLSDDLLLKHILANEENAGIVTAIGQMGISGLTYTFFQQLSQEIETRKKKGNQIAANQLIQCREILLNLQKTAQEASQQLLEAASVTLQTILDAKDPRSAIQKNSAKIDETLLYVLENSITNASQPEQKKVLQTIQQLIEDEFKKQLPPEIQFLNDLASTDDSTARKALLDQHPEMVTPEFIELIKAAGAQIKNSGDEELVARLDEISAAIKEKLPA